MKKLTDRQKALLLGWATLVVTITSFLISLKVYPCDMVAKFVDKEDKPYDNAFYAYNDESWKTPVIPLNNETRMYLITHMGKMCFWGTLVDRKFYAFKTELYNEKESRF